MSGSKKAVFDAVAAIETARSFHLAARSLEQIAAQTVARGKANLSVDLVKQITGEKAVPVVLHALALGAL